ncbi:hypothetical protein CLAFUW4_20036 [Fulvia fulva]|uniref:uncharacterized protein n=1 Tax=Passalora fulva TaxID=5499 RepID=UPI0028526B48|nr:uncharacterized protein CLAFUR5_20036 [Fulvia fulva]KAK4626810.1 hypothetical protein CLAFUR4_20036 [Fulvia fulva]KAK4628529.1 hypothetical protein CLAFUR0_20036 [Fulvia fulva]WMI38862.1 hypothetical protein CLAFUR5_20036 [Fulvia fulva]WPV13995.1 hypothetical protein CLAFUW4_20036 [Fulvia fulva]WPV28525.1 hypothetical protein CLAFUW7_20036 [Fulvia fulva]
MAIHHDRQFSLRLLFTGTVMLLAGCNKVSLLAPKLRAPDHDHNLAQRILLMLRLRRKHCWRSEHLRPMSSGDWTCAWLYSQLISRCQNSHRSASRSISPKQW